jgi:hypothetical protein
MYVMAWPLDDAVKANGTHVRWPPVAARLTTTVEGLPVPPSVSDEPLGP